MKVTQDDFTNTCPYLKKICTGISFGGGSLLVFILITRLIFVVPVKQITPIFRKFSFLGFMASLNFSSKLIVQKS